MSLLSLLVTWWRSDPTPPPSLPLEQNGEREALSRALLDHHTRALDDLTSLIDPGAQRRLQRLEDEHRLRQIGRQSE